MSELNYFDLTGKVVLVTGGAGLLGEQHAKIIAAYGGTAIVADIDEMGAHAVAERIGEGAIAISLDITNPDSILTARTLIEKKYGVVDILINNAARNPKVEPCSTTNALSRVEDIELNSWNADIAVGLTGSMLCTRYFGERMAERCSGVIVNVSSDLGLIAPDQRLYEVEGLAEDKQPKKPLSYSVVKSGLIGMTRYFATYWADKGVRVNALCAGGVENGQNPQFLKKIAERIPMGRMAQVNEYQGAILFLSSSASSYMTGAVLSVDGGRTCW